MHTKQAKAGIVLAAGLMLGGCTPALRAMPLGPTAVGSPAGNVEIGMSPGLHYYSLESPDFDDGHSTFAIPVASGHLTYSLSDTMAINVRSAGLGTIGGFKIQVLKGPFTIAVMPEVGFGYIGTTHEVDAPGAEDQDSSGFALGMGGHGLFEHESGFFGNAGYSLSYTGTSQDQGGGNELEIGIVDHDLSIGAGYGLKMGGVSIRPEMQLVFRVASSAEAEGGGGDADWYTGPAFFLGVTIAGASAL